MKRTDFEIAMVVFFVLCIMFLAVYLRFSDAEWRYL